MKVLTESMTKMQIHELTIRVWREEPDPTICNKRYYNGVQDQLIQIYEGIPDGEEMWYSELAAKFLKIDRMNAVEVLNSEGNGVVMYKDWP